MYRLSKKGEKMVKKQKNISNCNKVKGKKWGLKILSFGLLGVMLASTGLVGLGHATTQAQTAQGGSTLTDGDAIDNSFNLHPETDPVIYTTESGLDIKVSLAIDANGVLTGYTYFTMGTYTDGSAINWLIIGRNSQTVAGNKVTSVNYSTSLAYLFSTSSPLYSIALNNWLENYYENITPPGSVIKDDIGTDQVFVDQGGATYTVSITFSSQERVNDTDLEPGEVLCMSQYSVGTAYHQSSYEGTSFQTFMSNLFISDLGLTDEQKSVIIPKTIITRNVSSFPCYFFPLAYSTGNSNFYFSSYLNLSTQIGEHFGLRGYGGYSQYYIDRSNSSNSYKSYEFVLPGSANNAKTKACFVMKLA